MRLARIRPQLLGIALLLIPAPGMGQSDVARRSEVAADRAEAAAARSEEAARRVERAAERIERLLERVEAAVPPQTRPRGDE